MHQSLQVRPLKTIFTACALAFLSMPAKADIDTIRIRIVQYGGP